jgi:D-serine deaminase-like pyridoxal phosphate-dependent protein
VAKTCPSGAHPCAETGVFTELQPGSYVFNDADYSRNHGSDGSETWLDPWAPSLFLLTQVMSLRPPEAAASSSAHATTSGWAVLDSGLKSQSTDSGPGVILCAAHDIVARRAGSIASCAAWSTQQGCFECPSGYGRCEVAGVSDEHTKIVPRVPGASLPPVGCKLLLVPGHCDPFVNHYDWLIAVEDGIVAALWCIGARSPGI